MRNLKRLFPDEQLLFLRSEDLSATAQSELDKVTDFLEVERFGFTEEPRHNSATDSDRMTPEDRAWLEDVFRLDAEETRHLLGWERGPWSV